MCALRSEIPWLLATAVEENLVARLSSFFLGAEEPASEIEAGGLPGTACCSFEDVLQSRDRKTLPGLVTEGRQRWM